jgi:16S rRNA G966 N2-methylase RsmD
MTSKLVVGDGIEAMSRLPAECADLIFADPPFNIGYEYHIYDDRRSRDEYLAWADAWLRVAVRFRATKELVRRRDRGRISTAAARGDRVACRVQLSAGRLGEGLTGAFSFFQLGG